MIAAIDLDGVVCDLHAVWLSRYNALFNDNLTVDKITEWNISKFVKPECGLEIFDFLDDPSVYDDVSPIEGALEGVMQLRSAGHRVVFVTSSVNGVAGRKLRWLQDNNFLNSGVKSEKDYVECHDKSLIRADVLVDDYHGNLLGFQGKRIQFLQPWNVREFVPGAWLACNWDEVPQIIEDMVIEEQFQNEKRK